MLLQLRGWAIFSDVYEGLGRLSEPWKRLYIVGWVESCLWVPLDVVKSIRWVARRCTFKELLLMRLEAVGAAARSGIE